MKKKIIFIFVLVLGLCLVTGCGNTAESNTSIEKDVKDVDIPKKASITEIQVGDTIKNDNYEFKLNSLSFKKELKYKVSSHFTRSVSIDNGKVVYALEGTFKNLMGNKIDGWQPIKCKVIIDDKYNYDGSLEKWEELDPLVNAHIVLYAQVPSEIQDSYKKVQIIFGFNNNFESEFDQNVEDLENVFSITTEKQ